MAVFGSGKMAKLKIKAFKDVERKNPIGTFEAMYNPTSISQKYEIAYGKRQALNSTGISAKYMWSKPRELHLELILDGADVQNMGIAKIKAQKSVSERVSDFISLAYRMSGSRHEPSYLAVEWGELDWGEQFKANVFSCRLASVDVTYNSFDRNGAPLRAKLDIVLISDIEAIKRLREEKKSSPDLTHTRVVRSGDTLPLLTKEIYGASKYYLQVARVNNLDDFRNLMPGTVLDFPPIEK
jgi:LysM repeat protein